MFTVASGRGRKLTVSTAGYDIIDSNRREKLTITDTSITMQYVFNLDYSREIVQFIWKVLNNM